MAGEQPLIVIIGPTAVGKTRLAIAIAQAIKGEIISADSRQIYRYMDIGTAKPTPEECDQAAHHLIDIIDPDYNLTLAEYQDMAYAAINDIHARNRVPLLVGGTGQYITAVEEGWSIPRVPPNHTLRQELEQFVQENGIEALHRRLADVDELTATKTHPNNTRRVIRALEVYMTTGTPISILQRKKPPPYRIMTYGITMEREPLYERADQRVDHMMEEGFLEEVQGLLEMGYDRHLPSMSGLGYLEMVAHLKDELSLEEAVTRTKFATHNFIRRQYVWFRGHDNGIMWHNGVTLDTDMIIHEIRQWM